MEILTKDIEITHFVSGFHSFTKDHNFTNFKGNLINDISKELGITLDEFKFNDESRLKSFDKDPDLFEIKITPQALIYQDNLPLEDFTKTALKFLEIWKKYNDLISLRLIGIVRVFKLNIKPYESIKDLNITNRFFKSKTAWDEIVGGKISLKFRKKMEDDIYNIHITLSEEKEKEYLFNGLIDFHKISVEPEHPIKDSDIIRIFERANKYFESEFISILNNK